MTQDREPSFAKGIIVSFLILATSLVAILIPLIGVFLALTMIPYLAGALGARFSHPKERVPLSLTCSMVWSIVETSILLGGLTVFVSSTPMGLVLDGFGLFLIAMMWLSNIIFMLLGAFHPWNDPFSDLK